MSRIYDALIKVMEDSQLDEEKVRAVKFSMSKDSNPAGLSSEIAELEKIFLSHVGKMASALKQIETASAHEAQQARQIEDYLAAQVKEKEAALEAKEYVIRNAQETLQAKIRDLENQILEKNGLLDIRDRQIEDLKSKLDTLVGRMNRMAALLKQAGTLAGMEEEKAGGNSSDLKQQATETPPASTKASGQSHK